MMTAFQQLLRAHRVMQPLEPVLPDAQVAICSGCGGSPVWLFSPEGQRLVQVCQGCRQRWSLEVMSEQRRAGRLVLLTIKEHITDTWFQTMGERNQPLKGRQ